MSGIVRIAVERKRQIEKLGWTPAHDAEHTDRSLVLAAICYAASATDERVFVKQDLANGTAFTDPWPESWDVRWDARHHNGNVLQDVKRTDKRIRLLEKAGALIAAEIDRLERAKEAT